MFNSSNISVGSVNFGNISSGSNSRSVDFGSGSSYFGNTSNFYGNASVDRGSTYGNSTSYFENSSVETFNFDTSEAVKDTNVSSNNTGGHFGEIKKVIREAKKQDYEDTNAIISGNKVKFAVPVSDVLASTRNTGLDIAVDDISEINETSSFLMVKLKNGGSLVIDRSDKTLLSFQINGCEYKYDSSGNIYSANIDHSIFDSSNSMSGQYGGSQDDFYENSDLLKDENILRILNERFGETTYEQKQIYLNSVSSCGCHFAAIANKVMEQYTGREKEFLNTFGYPMYTVDKYGNIDYNYEALILDIHSYYWTHNFTTTNGDGEVIWSNYGSSDISTAAYYANGTGINDKGAEVCLQYLNQEYGIDCNGMTSINDHIIGVDEYNQYISEGKQLIINSNSYELVAMDGTYALNNYQNYGHAMAVTGFTTDALGQTVMTVTDRGVEYMIYPREIGNGNFVYYDIIDF